MARARTKSGRFSKSRRRPTRGKRYTVRARRRNPARTGSYYPKKGQRRLSAPSRRRAYSKRRRNQKGIMASPAVKYGIAASVGFFGAAWADSAPFLNPKKEDGTPMLPWGIRGSLLGAIALGLLSNYALTGRNKQYGFAAAVGMAAPTAIGLVNTMLPGGAMHELPSRGAQRQLTHARAARAASQFVKASANLDNQAA
jgi:hypothetical protein